MKKLLLLFLTVVGFVGTASAAKLYVNTSTNASWWTNVRIYAYNSNDDEYNTWAYSEDGVVASTQTFFGKDWYVFDMGNYSNAIVQYFQTDDHSISNQSTDITGITNDRFIFIPGTATDGKWVWYENGYTFRCNVLGENWEDVACNMTVVDANTLSYTLTKSVIDASGKDKIWFRLLNQEGQIYPQEEGFTLSIGGNTSTYYNNWTGTTWSFGIEIPSYDYEKIVVKASLSNTIWTISADAYITVPVSQYGMSTFCSANPLDFSAATPSGLKAYRIYANDKATGELSKEEVTTVPANTGVYLEGTASTNYSVPVTATASSIETNWLVGVTANTDIAQTADGKTNYILTVNKATGNVDVPKFYKVNGTDGNTVLANRAYLQIPTTLATREMLWFGGDEATSVNDVKVKENTVKGEVYDLQGRRVANPMKGLYIVNGKKVIF